MSGYISNNNGSTEYNGMQFMFEQRNVGFVNNDGWWILYQLGENRWTSYGTLRRRRDTVFMGAFESQEDMFAAIQAAQHQPEIDEPVTTIGRVSC